MDSRILLFLATLFVSADVGAREIPSVFLISKSENRNQVHFALRVDDACKPAIPAPVRPYWRMLEQSSTQTEPLLSKEERVYGIESQMVDGVRVTIRLRALREHPIAIRTWRDPGGACRAVASTNINGKSSRLFDVHVALGPFGVRYVLITGWDDDGNVVREKISS